MIGLASARVQPRTARTTTGDTKSAKELNINVPTKIKQAATGRMRGRDGDAAIWTPPHGCNGFSVRLSQLAVGARALHPRSRRQRRKALYLLAKIEAPSLSRIGRAISTRIARLGGNRTFRFTRCFVTSMLPTMVCPNTRARNPSR